MLPKFTSEDHAYVRRPPAAGPRLPTRRLPRRSGQQRMGGIPATRSASLAYSVDSYWRNRAEFVQGRPAIIDFLTRKWTRELDYRLIKELWSFTDNRIAVRFAYEWRDDSLNWFRSFGNENWEFYSNRPHAAALCMHQRPAHQVVREKVLLGSRWSPPERPAGPFSPHAVGTEE
jgi:uncharacterized protein